MPRLGDEMNGRGIPLQQGPGLETIWPSEALSGFEARQGVYRDRLRAAEDVAAITMVVSEARGQYQIAASRIPPSELRHLSTEWDFFLKMAEQYAAMVRYRQPQCVICTRRGVHAHWGEESFDDAYERTTIGNPGASSFAGIIAGAQIIEPEPYALLKRRAVEPIQYAQGLARGYWQGGVIGRFPGYAGIRSSSLPS